MNQSLSRIIFSVIVSSLCIIPSLTHAREVKNVDSIYEGAKPLVVLIERNPWLMAIGSDTPSFVLYDNGQAIFSTMDKENKWEYRSVTITGQELENLKNKLINDTVFSLNKSYEIAKVTDQTDNVFYFSDGNRKKVLSIYGRLESLIDSTKASKFEDLSSLPDVLKEAYRTIKNLRPDNSETWKPRYIEVVYKKNLVGSLPNGWEQYPVFKRQTLFSIYLPFDKLSEATKFAKEHSGNTTLGHTVYSLRYVFPNEPLWLNEEKTLWTP